MTPKPRSSCFPRSSYAIIGGVVVAVVLLLIISPARFGAFAPLVLGALVCPVMMAFMMRGARGACHDPSDTVRGDDARGGGDRRPPEVHPPSV